MSVRANAFAAAFALLLAGDSAASAAADIEGEIVLPGGPNVVAGAVGTIELRLTNLGPDAAQFPSMGLAWSPTPGHRTYEVFPIPETAPCEVRYTDFIVPPPDVSTIGANVYSPLDLAAGATLVCRVGIVVFDDLGRETFVRVRFASPTFDPDESNNDAQVVLSTAPRLIPTGDWRGAIVLVVLMLGGIVAGWFLAKR